MTHNPLATKKKKSVGPGGGTGKNPFRKITNGEIPRRAQKGPQRVSWKTNSILQNQTRTQNRQKKRRKGKGTIKQTQIAPVHHRSGKSRSSRKALTNKVKGY